jgi:hypothetical protein
MSIFDQLIEANKYKSQMAAAKPTWGEIIGKPVGDAMALAGKAKYDQATELQKSNQNINLKVIDNLTTGKDLINISTGQPATTEEYASVLKGFHNGALKVSKPDTQGNVIVGDAAGSEMKYAFVPKQSATTQITVTDANKKDLIAMGIITPDILPGTVITKPLTTANTVINKLGQGQLDKGRTGALAKDPQYTTIETQWNNALQNWKTINDQFKAGNASQAQVDEAIAEKDSAAGKFNGYVKRKYGSEFASQLFEVVKEDKPVWYGTKTVESVVPAGGAPTTSASSTSPAASAPTADPAIQAKIDELKKTMTIPKIKQLFKQGKATRDLDLKLYKF